MLGAVLSSMNVVPSSRGDGALDGFFGAEMFDGLGEAVGDVALFDGVGLPLIGPDADDGQGGADQAAEARNIEPMAR